MLKTYSTAVTQGLIAAMLVWMLVLTLGEKRPLWQIILGSLLAGPKDLITRANRIRRRLGGAMRQTGILAAAALHGLQHHRARLAEDHAHARRLAERVAACRQVQLDLATVQTNIVVFHLKPGAPDAPTVVAQARAQGTLVSAFGPRTVRAVTHLDVSAAQCDEAAATLSRLLD